MSKSDTLPKDTKNKISLLIFINLNIWCKNVLGLLYKFRSTASETKDISLQNLNTYILCS